MTARFLRRIPLLPLILILLSACPAMVNSPAGAPGGPLGAGGSEKTEPSVDPSEETTSPPPAVPPPPGGGGDPAGTPPPMEPAFRRIEGGDAHAEIPVSGPVATRDGGIFSAPTPAEWVDTHRSNLRILYWSSSVRRTWANAEDFFAKLRTGNIVEEIARQAKVQHTSALVCPTCRLEAESPTVRSEEQIPSSAFFAIEPGYYLFFITEDGPREMGPVSLDVTSTAHLKNLIKSDQVDLDGDEFRLKFLGERTIFSLPTIDPDVLRQPLPGVMPKLELKIVK